MDFKRFFAAVAAVAVVCLIVLSGCSGGNNLGSTDLETPNSGTTGAPAAEPAAGLLDQVEAKGEITSALEGT